MHWWIIEMILAMVKRTLTTTSTVKTSVYETGRGCSVLLVPKSLTKEKKPGNEQIHLYKHSEGDKERKLKTDYSTIRSDFT